MQSREEPPLVLKCAVTAARGSKRADQGIWDSLDLLINQSYIQYDNLDRLPMKQQGKTIECTNVQVHACPHITLSSTNMQNM